jgi:DNA/RNA endonuclease YhcR with UshA esterase domain
MRACHLKASTLILIAAICLSERPAQSRAADAVKPPAATQPATTQPVAIKWDQAAKHVGETCTVTGPVVGTHVTKDAKALILNVGKDYQDPAHFSIMISVDDKHPAKEDDYKGKTVTVTGKVELYRKAAEIKVAKAADVTVEKE